MTSAKKSMFVAENGQSYLFTFVLVSSLFLLWGFCNGMIDVMDKHFQKELHLTLAQSAWVQFAHYLGYFLMALPAGWLATKLGYKGGIIAGLLMVAVGGLWFVPATHIAQFWAFLLGVCVIAAGLTFLETVANPYTTVLGPPEFAAARINLAQSCNSVGWLLGPFAGAMFFYSKDAAGQSTGSETLWIPYAGVAIVVVVLAFMFFLASVPDVQSKDLYHLEDKDAVRVEAPATTRRVNRGLVYCMLVGNALALIGAIGMILWVILSTLDLGPRLVPLVSWMPLPSSITVTQDNSLALLVIAAGCLAAVIAAAWLASHARNVSSHSIWSHPHFSAATLAQFFYVAAQAGIFSFFINYMTAEVPAIPESWTSGVMSGLFTTSSSGTLGLTDQGAAFLLSAGFLCFLAGRFSGAVIIKKSAAHKVLGLYGLLNVLACLVVFLKLGWISVACVFLSFFFMSIMFPTIFALGIHGLGARAKRASAYIVMAIMGGAIIPKVMGAVADHYNMSKAFIVPLICFAIIAAYGYLWPRLSKADGLPAAREK
jgi:FHS family L-fucose permease-like MFS transporter